MKRMPGLPPTVFVILATVLAFGAFRALARPATRVTLVVGSADDNGPATLRQALLDAQPDDVITFDPNVFPPTTPMTITLANPLPGISQDGLALDASDAGVVVDGNAVGGEMVPGLDIEADGVTMRGLQIVGFSGYGIELHGQNNVIGGDPSLGDGPLGQSNLLSDNGQSGIGLFGAETLSNTVNGNLIGTDPTGQFAWGNQRDGVHINGAHHNLIAGNVIGGNQGAGIQICCTSDSAYNTVRDNLIGVGSDGQTPLPNFWKGIVISDGANGNTIGPGNVIANNSGGGIGIIRGFAPGNTILDNSIYDNQENGIALRNENLELVRVPAIAAFDLASGTASGVACPDCLVQIYSDEYDQGQVFEGQAVALLEDGRVLVQATMRYTDGASLKHAVPLTAQLVPSREGFAWAGPALTSQVGGDLVVRCPAGQEELAAMLLADAQSLYGPLTEHLGAPEGPVTIQVFQDVQAYQGALPLSAPAWVPVWTGPGESLRLLFQEKYSLEEQRYRLAQGLAEHLLAQMGLGPGWLRTGLASYEAGRLVPARGRAAAAAELPRVARAVRRGGGYPLEVFPVPSTLSPAEGEQAQAQANEAVRYLVEAHGWAAVLDLVREVGQGRSLEEAFPAALGQTVAAFDGAWREAVVRGYAAPDWVEVAQAFSGDAALAHVQALTVPEWHGRQAGSPGAGAAAAYIAQQFAALGLTPAGDDGTFFQQVPISYTVWTAAPRLILLDGDGRVLEEFPYRESFAALVGGGAGGGTVTGELVWVREADYAGMRLGGRIAVRRAEGPWSAEVARAIEHGAGGLILAEQVGTQFLAKDALPVTEPLSGTIPVVEVTLDGLKRLLESAGSSLAVASTSPPALPLGLEARLEVPLSPPAPAHTANVLGLLPGVDPGLGHEVVVVGAHYDHVGDDPEGLFCVAGASDPRGGPGCEVASGRKYPGANDDASGVAVLLEVARLWHEAGYRPARSVLFAAWGAQEPGEVGAAYYVAHPTLPLTDTVAMLQLDAVGGSHTGYYLEARGDRRREDEGQLLFFVEAAGPLVGERPDLQVALDRSDERPFRAAGIPSLLFTWRGADEQNLPAELADAVDPLRLRTAGRLVTLTLMMLAH